MRKIGFDVDPKKLPDGRFRAFLERCDELRYSEKTSGVVVNGLPVSFDFSDRNIGITFSGGADSSLLLYILCRIIDEFKTGAKIYPISVVRNWMPGLRHTSEAKSNVIAHLGKLFPGIIQDITWSFMPDVLDRTPASSLVMTDVEKTVMEKTENRHADVFYFTMLALWAADKNNLQTIYGGATSNPPPESKTLSGPLFREQMHMSLQEFRLPDGPLKYYGVEYKHRDPFLFIDKTWIIAQYRNFAIEDLYRLTKSCERDENGCGSCFHCDERRWGEENCGPFLEAAHA
jgi:hypothetical protein